MNLPIRPRDDSGFSLSELIVVIGLLGLVLSGAYALFYLARVSTNESSAQSWAAREIGQPLENMERMFSQQAPPLVVAESYICEIQTDQDRDDRYEFRRFEATANGRLIETVYELVDQPTPRVAVWSTSNANRATSTPLFTYYNIDGEDITTRGSVHIKQYAASVEVTIVGNHNGREYSDSRRVFFRNR